MTTSDLHPLAVPAAEAAALLGVSRSQLYKLNSQGKLPSPIRLGTRAPRWRVSDLEAWLAAGCPDRATWERTKGGAM